MVKPYIGNLIFRFAHNFVFFCVLIISTLPILRCAGEGPAADDRRQAAPPVRPHSPEQGAGCVTDASDNGVHAP